MSGEEIGVLVGGIVTVIGAVVAAVNSVITQARTRRIVEVNDRQTAQLSTITVLVNGRYSELLNELALVRRLLSEQTGCAMDALRAEQAEAKAERQVVRVESSMGADGSKDV